MKLRPWVKNLVKRVGIGILTGASLLLGFTGCAYIIGFGPEEAAAITWFMIITIAFLCGIVTMIAFTMSFFAMAWDMFRDIVIKGN